ncbi:MAG: DNA replication licensing factor Mcm5 [Amphiamblys sp. WSBS2006]|nr:MAG: DNA replication licensing factor Mcm5 [Amphiamblys sp. WSBS2006]
MSGWDRGETYSADMHIADAPESVRILVSKCDAFFESFRNKNIFPYREMIRRNTNLGLFMVEIEMEHIFVYDETLGDVFLREPNMLVPMLETAACGLAKRMCETEEEESVITGFQVLVRSSLSLTPIHFLSSHHIAKIVRISGIVISVSTCLLRPQIIYAVCRSCMSHVTVSSKHAFGGISLPRTCQGTGSVAETKGIPCPLDPFVVVPEQCTFVDQQVIKIQELHETIEPGEMPCTITATINRTLVNKLAPGTRVVATGVFSTTEGRNANKTVRMPYMNIIHIEETESSLSHRTQVWSEEEEQLFLQMSRDKDIYAKIAASIGPSIYGNEDIKRAVACLLFSGSRKALPDGIRIRGDINVLLLGDPGTAKSQVLKFAQKIAPISVYTSGKGSSAAGLTASVIKGPTGGFYLEGGAMVLADGGVVCIDEFDKMDEEDRVAIHEAMEQQTISIAKAGITTVLNTRCAVLAAANPAFGRYDEMHTSCENIDFPATILSRFDMIFIVKDEHIVAKDITLAKHVLATHMEIKTDAQSESEIDTKTLRNYIAYARGKCAPRVSPEAAAKLGAHYVAIRNDVRKQELENNERGAIPITVRQLEAVVRIAEALAKMALLPVATEEHVEEALRLFRLSTMNAVASGHTVDGILRPEAIREIERVEKEIRRRLSVGSSVLYTSLINQFAEEKQFSETSIMRAVDIMVRQGKLVLHNKRKVLIRQF